MTKTFCKLKECENNEFNTILFLVINLLLSSILKHVNARVKELEI